MSVEPEHPFPDGYRILPAKGFNADGGRFVENSLVVRGINLRLEYTIYVYATSY